MGLQNSVIIFLTIFLIHSSTSTPTKLKKIRGSSPQERNEGIPLEEVLVYNNTKFYTVNIQSTWSQSLELCHSHGKVAAVINAPNELIRLGLNLKFSSSYLSKYFWTGGHDLIEEGKFQWLNPDSSMNLNLPSKFVGSVDRNCVQINFEGYLFDWKCDSTNALPLCQDV